MTGKITAQGIVDGYRKGQEKNRAQHAVNLARTEAFLQAADEVGKLLREESLPAIAAWVKAIRVIAEEETA